MYNFLTGPMLWVTFSVLVIGCAARVAAYFKGLDWRLDRVAYKPHMGRGLKWALKSIGWWLLPFGSRSWREKPGMTILFFAFHIGIVFVPLFLEAHAVVVRERLGIAWPAMPATLADGLSIAMLVAGILLILRRIVLPEVRIITTAQDYLILALTMAPFITGLACRLHLPGYETWLLAHIISGHAMLLAIPFTKLSHVVLFFCSRAQLGMDFGIKRGGQHGRGIVW
ncbi:sulfate respiration complex protein HmcE [Desulfocurvus sp. DL9XJH121]